MAKADHHSRPDPWGQGRTFGALSPDELQYIVDTDGHAAEDVKTAKALLKPATPPPPPAAAQAPPPPPSSASAGFSTGTFAAAPAANLAPATGFAAPAPPANAPATSFTAPAAAFPGTPAPPTAQAAPAGLPAGFPGAPAPAPAAPPVNPKKLAVDTAIQGHKHSIFANHDDLRRFLGVWGVGTTGEATDEHLDQMAGVLAADPATIVPWLAQYPIPA